MKNKLLLFPFLALFIFQGKLSAQSLEIGYGHFGAMVYWQGTIPAAGETWEIKRTGPDTGSPGKSWRIQAARQADEFLRNTGHIPPVFKGLFPVTLKSAEYYTEKLRASASTESLPMAQAPNILFALGLAVWDTTAMQGVTYQYQIFRNDAPVGQPATLRTQLPDTYDWAPTFHSATNNERIIRCRWKIPEDKKPEVYTYLAYRTAPFKPEYALVSGISSFAVSSDTVMAVFMDTSAASAPGIYQYMIRTVNRFGLLGPVSEYALGSNFPPEAEPIMIYFKAHGQQDQPAIRLEWRILNAWRIRSMALYRSRSYNGPYEMIGHFSPQDSTYLDPVNDVMESYFYYFEMQDMTQQEPLLTARVTSVSDYHWPAEIPDSVEAHVQGKAINITWKRSGFQDRGYYVLRSQGYGDPETIVSEMIPVSGDQQVYQWTDTSSVLTPEHTYTYAVISESHGYEKSLISETVQARQAVPLYVPPPTELKLSRLTETMWLLRWSDLSGDETIQHLGYKVFQKDPKAKDGFRSVHEGVLFFETNYTELNDLRPGDVFAVKAYNIYGDESAFSDTISLVDPYYYRFGPQYLMGVNEETGIRIKWNRPQHTDIAGYTLYRVGADQKMTQVANPAATDVDWLDTKVKSGETYYYFITANTSAKQESEASEWLPVTR